jgi:hypothetical protein
MYVSDRAASLVAPQFLFGMATSAGERDTLRAGWRRDESGCLENVFLG